MHFQTEDGIMNKMVTDAQGRLSNRQFLIDELAKKSSWVPSSATATQPQPNAPTKTASIVEWNLNGVAGNAANGLDSCSCGDD
jgi:hypothetical protein